MLLLAETLLFYSCNLHQPKESFLLGSHAGAQQVTGVSRFKFNGQERPLLQEERALAVDSFLVVLVLSALPKIFRSEGVSLFKLEASKMVGPWVWATVVAWTIALVAALVVGVLYTRGSGRCTSTRRLDGKTAIITGASAGIGKETARDLAGRGARVILACRNTEKAQKVANEIIAVTGNQQVLVRHVDTSNMSSVRKFAYGILSSENNLHILINNAGIPGYTTRKLTSEGLEMAMATNHFGHFLLTNLLLDLLKASAPSRVVNVTSNAHWMCHHLDTDDLNYKWRHFPGWLPSYGQSKLSNILFTLELSQRLEGTGVTTNSVHPGVVNTEIFWKEGWKIINFYAVIAAWIMAKDEKLGAQPVVYLAVSEEVDNVSGKYFVDCKEAPSSTLAQDPALAKRLWGASEKLVDLHS
ncbi:retinol dehydrogenase 13-like [Penaeus japonicus]|uniref:retinol dehydrogenase 13-like n=1 Tax=Penaeus japonicus TaxID=27405 RepID=UPI001C71052F|nr:retinol dehydrogenase 13-like [Penaeus japonicus]